MTNKSWDGRAVSVEKKGLDGILSNKHFRVELTEKATRTLALALMRLKQTTLTLPGDCQELLDALNYVTVGDPHSVKAHQAMEAGKGMTPDGGYMPPDNALVGRTLADMRDITLEPGPGPEDARLIRPGSLAKALDPKQAPK